MKRIAAAAIVLAALAIPAAARGDVVNTFSFQLKDVRSSGSYTVLFSWRSYDTSGLQPPPLVENYIRFPKGAVLRKEFLKKRFFCNVLAMREAQNPRVCRKSQIGKGRVSVDARRVKDENGVAYLPDPVPADVYVFLGKPRFKKAVASFVIMGIPDVKAPIVRDNPTIRDTKPVVYADLINDPTPDGRFQYKLVLPVGPIAGFDVSVAEGRVETKGLRYTKVQRRCVKKKRGRCVRRSVKRSKRFWFTKPTCPPSGKLPFESTYGSRGLPTQKVAIEIPCPDFG
jgi:hypothetical protein